MSLSISSRACWRWRAGYGARSGLEAKPLSVPLRQLHVSPRQYEDRPEFRPQLMDSVARRLERERKEQKQFVEAREARDDSFAFARFIALVATGGICYYLGTLGRKPSAPESTLPLEACRPSNRRLDSGMLQAAWADMVDIVGEDNVSTDEETLLQHADSEWSTYNAKSHERPFLVVYPATTDDVSRIARICHRRQIPMTAFSGGTSLEGHYSPTRGGICIDFQRMDQILQIHKEDLDVVVQPAVGWQDLNAVLSQQGLFFPPDPGPGAMIGGMIGTGCSGTNAFHYGTMKDWVLSLTVVLADGTIIKTRQRPRKSSAGYDLTRLFIGSEGTLGLVTEATLKVTVKPRNESVGVASFATIRDAAQCVAKLVDSGVPVAAIELLDDAQMRCINQSGVTKKQRSELPTLFFKFAGTLSGVKEQIYLTRKLARDAGSKSFDFARNETEAAELWSARKEALFSVMAQKRDAGDHVWTTDVAVPISRLPDVIEKTQDDLASSGLLGTIVGHVGDGNFHAIILFNDQERTLVEGVVHRMMQRAIEAEGTVTGEHGVGLVKRDFLEQELGQTAVDTMRKIKQALDPLNLLNCDKVVRMSSEKRTGIFT